MRSSKIWLRKLKLRLRDKRFANHKAPCTAIWQQPLQSVLALRGCSATDLFYFYYINLNTVYMQIFCAYFFWNLEKKNWGARNIWNKVGTALPPNKWSCHALRSEVWITCYVDYGYKISLSLIHSERKAYDNWRSRKHWKPCSGKKVWCERMLYSWLAQQTKCDLEE